jgi:hypothetical protein
MYLHPTQVHGPSTIQESEPYEIDVLSDQNSEGWRVQLQFFKKIYIIPIMAYI